MSCLHIVMSVYYLLVDYYVYFVYVCMLSTIVVNKDEYKRYIKNLNVIFHHSPQKPPLN